jgi:DNA-binding response OmpR family regulator
VSGVGRLPNTKTAILLVDDDDAVRDVVGRRLEAAGYAVREASNGEAALEAVRSRPPDLIVLDLVLGGMDGLAVLRAVRAGSRVPVIMLTSAGDEADRVLALELGADDYVVKPFLPRELVARVRALLRRSQTLAPSTLLVFDELIIDLQAREAFRDGQLIALTNREFELLAFLAASPRRTFSRAQLLEHVWGADGWQDEATVTEHMHRLRRRVEADPSHPRRLATVRGVGYRFDP